MDKLNRIFASILDFMITISPSFLISLFFKNSTLIYSLYIFLILSFFRFTTQYIFRLRSPGFLVFGIKNYLTNGNRPNYLAYLIHGYASYLYIFIPFSFLFKLGGELLHDVATGIYPESEDEQKPMVLAGFLTITFLISGVLIGDINHLISSSLSPSRKSGDDITGYWYRYNDGNCFVDTEVVYISENSIYNVSKGSKNKIFLIKKSDIKNNKVFMILNANKPESKHLEFTIDYRDVGSILEAVKWKIGGKTRRTKGIRFFPQFSLAKCHYPTIKGRIQGLWKDKIDTSRDIDDIPSIN